MSASSSVGIKIPLDRNELSDSAENAGLSARCCGPSCAMAFTGISMCSISNSRQVICVTHLPQIASMADRHFIVTKESDEKTTRTYLSELKEEKRIQEIARLSGGDSQAARNHAKEMLNRACLFKTTT